jgi:hypothetical protein
MVFVCGRVRGLVVGFVLLGLVLLFGGLFGGGVAWGGVVAAPAWQVTDVGIPTVLPAGLGKTVEYYVVVENVGGAPSSGSFTVKDDFPAGITVSRVLNEPTASSCETLAREVKCEYSEAVVPSGFVVVGVLGNVTGSTSGGLGDVGSVSGGGAPEASDEAVMRAGAVGEKAPPGISKFRFDVTGPAGEPVTQAAGHPNFLTTTVLFNNQYIEGAEAPARPVEAIKDVVFYLPLGLLGNPTVAENCPPAIIETKFGLTGCLPSSRVGSILPMILNNITANQSDPTHESGVFNINPEEKFAAEFAFASDNYTFVIYAKVVRHDGRYMVRIETPGLPRIAALIGLISTFYGDLSEKYTQEETEYTFDRGAFLTDPSNCQASGGELDASVAFDSWERPDSDLASVVSTPVFTRIGGCQSVGFSSVLRVRPESTQADAPSGYEVGLEVPQAPNVGAGVGTPPVRDVTVTFPLGTSISPSGANGLLACQETGPSGINIEGAESEAIGEDGLLGPVAGHCPVASRIATVRGSTPLLHEELSGHVFVAAPQCGGAGQAACTEEDAADGRLFGLYMELEGPKSGVIVKLKGRASVNPQTGQVTASFEEIPQFPFSELVTSTKGGADAPLANSQTCGAASSSAVVVPWSSPLTPSAAPTDAFSVDWDGAGGGCPASAPFAPAFTAGTTSPVAAGTSPFTLSLKREDREGDIKSLSTTLPEGLLANVAGATKCPEPLASQDSLSACPAASQIGTTTVSVGSGSDPYYVTGKVFFTGPYGGAPFGLSVVVPAVAGPFNLGDVLVRVALFVDPHTAQATAVSGPLPQILDGVPLRIKSLNVTLSDSQFVLNPTNCSVKSITGTVYSTTGASAGVSSPFAAGGCKNLPFDPVLSASTQAKSTKANGTAVKVKIAYPAAGEANVSKLVISFPKQLPVRLSTLQQACRAATFEADPAGCPAASNIGTATAHTPILGQPLVGPVYLVSYGSAKFPDVVFVLQGEGVTLDVDGQSFVSHDGVLKVTFPSIPDAPFSTFETVLPAGRYSQFTSARSTSQAQASQCGENLIAPVSMTAQNGASITTNTRMQITGCGPTVSLGASKTNARSVTLTITTSTKGRVKITGPGLKTLQKSGLAAGTHKLTLALTSAGRQAARTHHKIQVTVGLVTGKQKTSKNKKITL